MYYRSRSAAVVAHHFKVNEFRVKAIVKKKKKEKRKFRKLLL